MSKFKPPRRASGSPSIASHKDLFSFVFSDNIEAWMPARVDYNGKTYLKNVAKAKESKEKYHKSFEVSESLT